MRQLGGITNSIEKSLSKLWEIVKDRETLWTGSAVVHRVEKIWTRLRLNNKGAETKQPGKEVSSSQWCWETYRDTLQKEAVYKHHLIPYTKMYSKGIGMKRQPTEWGNLQITYQIIT